MRVPNLFLILRSDMDSDQNSTACRAKICSVQCDVAPPFECGTVPLLRQTERLGSAWDSIRHTAQTQHSLYLRAGLIAPV